MQVGTAQAYMAIVSVAGAILLLVAGGLLISRYLAERILGSVIAGVLLQLLLIVVLIFTVEHLILLILLSKQ